MTHHTTHQSPMHTYALALSPLPHTLLYAFADPSLGVGTLWMLSNGNITSDWADAVVWNMLLCEMAVLKIEPKKSDLKASQP